MTPTTRTRDPTAALEHLLTSVFRTEEAECIRPLFKSIWIFSVHDFIGARIDDFEQEFNMPDETTASKLPVTLIQKLSLLQQWYATQDKPTVNTWFNLTVDLFDTWCTEYHVTRLLADTSIKTAPTSSATTTFRQNVKITVADYPKLKEDQQWRAFNRQLLATAAKS
jgi:hypothetical protein